MGTPAIIALALALGAAAAATWAWIRALRRSRAAEARGDALLADLNRTLSEASSQIESGERRLRRLVNVLPIGIFEADIHGAFRHVNRRLEEMTALDTASALGARWLSAVDPEDREAVWSAWEEAVRNRRVFGAEFRLRGRDGKATWVEARAGPWQDASGGIAGFVGAILDVQARKDLETAQRQQETRLQDAQRFESLGRLAGGVAHDFNNLLMSILGGAELAVGAEPAASPAHEFLDHIVTAATRGKELIAQLLAYSGQGQVKLELLDVSRLVEETGRLLAVAATRHTTVRYELDRELPPVEGDATQIRQVVMNLVTNAAEALGPEGGGITIRTSLSTPGRSELDGAIGGRELAAGRYVTISVSDNGVGMTDEERARIFEPFFTTKFKGRGLGLSAVLGIVHRHRGAIRVQSRKGEGTTFTLWFPAAAGRPALPDSGSPPPAAAPWSSEGTILVVDDEESVRTVAGRMLERQGFRVLAASSGAEAVRIFESRRGEIRAVLLDLTMPEMDGAECLRRLRAIDEAVKVILTSGYPEQLAGLVEGAPPAAFIAKPYRRAALLDAVRRALGDPAPRPA